ncbi:hypothetical protein COV11_04005 [Candidatus Woesearchaeota archaeon CG10_big_fil_rev_8_21_14_0_10_30_7]|nr:MAG: hypothetical protein COV11_04005 [Candidatus Woesearchaeota archaeon CG10_big_fil_rev_8_21_14_0_10_30_7]
MEVIISDASSLILSEKIKLLDLLLKKYKILIPEEVYNEAVIKGKQKNVPDAYKLEHKLKTRRLSLIKVKDTKKVRKVMSEFNIQQGETEVIILFFEQKTDYVLLDDHKAMLVCKAYEVPFLTTLTLVLATLKQKLTNKERAKTMIKELAIHGRYKDELIFRALEEVEKNE